MSQRRFQAERDLAIVPSRPTSSANFESLFSFPMSYLTSSGAYWVVRYKDNYNVTVHPAIAAIALWGFYDELQMSFVRLQHPWDRLRPGERMEVLERLGTAPNA